MLKLTKDIWACSNRSGRTIQADRQVPSVPIVRNFTSRPIDEHFHPVKGGMSRCCAACPRGLGLSPKVVDY